MKLQALRFLNAPAPDSPIKIDHTELDLTNIRSLHNSSMIVPSAYLIRTEDLKHLRSLGDLIVDRGQKHAAKQLSKLLLNQDGIPIIAGGFTAVGSLKKSIRKFLEHASKAERNAYIIGADPKIFSQLWAETEESKETVRKDEPGTFLTTDSEPCKDDFELPDILTMLSSVSVPKELKEEYIGDTNEVELVRKLILRAAAVDDPVLILGDHGTGKEKVARSIHEYGSRRKNLFVAVNCAAISPYLLEAELFGNKLTGHNVPVKKGLWELAHNGTLFLDEIGDILPDHQAKILRALQEGTIRPVGGTEEIKVNARIIAATNRPLLSMVQEGKFREDLYYRLYCIVIPTPPLKNHSSDIPNLAQNFWEIITGGKNPLPIEIIKELTKMPWPGNVRQLKAVLITLHAMFRMENIGVRHLRVVLYFHNQDIYPLKGRSSLKESILHQIASIPHLRRVDEVIRAFEVTLEPILKQKNIDSSMVQSLKASFQYRQDELEGLCRDPSLFNTETTFSVVHLLKGKFLYFQDLLQKNTEKALQYWKTDVGNEIRHTLSSISKEIGQITKNI